MKQHTMQYKLARAVAVLSCIALPFASLQAQSDSAAAKPAAKKKVAYTKYTFEGNFLMDEQTVMVPSAKSLEFVFQHRFGTVDKGFTDLFGIFGGAHIRLGLNYTPIDRLQIGAGIYSVNMGVDINAKYAILKQTRDGRIPVSVAWYGNVQMDTRKKDANTLFVTFSDRLSYFNQLMVARKLTEKLSVQGSFNISHFNNLEGYLDGNGKVQAMYQNTHLSFSVLGRYKVTDKFSAIAAYCQPLTQHPMNNPHPNISFGGEIRTSGHTFQVYFGNYNGIVPQINNLYNQNDYTKGQFLIGFNIDRFWSF